MPELTFRYNYNDPLTVIYDDNQDEVIEFWGNSFDFLIKPADTNLQFPQLKDQWLNETRFLSDPSEVYSNDNYIKIIELGKKVIPYLIEDLETANTDWLFALHQITGDDPIAPNHVGKFGLMKSDWLNWADKTGWRNLGKEKLVMEYAFND